MNQNTSQDLQTGTHYAVTIGSQTVGNEGWAYTGTLYRNGVRIATFEERGDGGDMPCSFVSREEEDAFRAHAIATAPADLQLASYYEHGFPIVRLVTRHLVEKDLTRDMARQVLVWFMDEKGLGCVKSPRKADTHAIALKVQAQNPGSVVLNLLPFDAAVALALTFDLA
ncbi:hypothetical protein SAMN05216466_106155 [Paraburkholderia phenazinium]|uniref:Uncharacterized protein n=1 Tax=Paraburkholderia phenazinium TaxID=60549 RepID=A0A1G7YF39_9BURK|nr:hypothetical protein [Paraburkholderia phenazinium]SDG94936.1 hypothetical protein SAMN05216466_106155 [Paraburkholderia phenazinium]